MTSHPLSLLLLVTCLMALASARRRIDCTRLVFHPACRGIAAKRSSPSSSSSSSSLLSSSSSPSSSSPHLTDDFINRLMFLTHSDGENGIDNGEADKEDVDDRRHNQQHRQQPLPQQQKQQQQQQHNSHHHNSLQQPQPQQQRRFYQEDIVDDGLLAFPFDHQQTDRLDKELAWRRTLLRVLLMELGSKNFGRQEFYGYFPGYNNEDTA